MVDRTHNDFQFLDLKREDPSKKTIQERTTGYA